MVDGCGGIVRFYVGGGGLIGVERFFFDRRSRRRRGGGGGVGIEFELGAGRGWRGRIDARTGEIEIGEIFDGRRGRLGNDGRSRSFFRSFSRPFYSSFSHLSFSWVSKSNASAFGAEMAFYLRVRDVRVGKAFAELASHRPPRAAAVAWSAGERWTWICDRFS